jgi:hypothetical protein
MILGLSMATWRAHLLVPRKTSVGAPLEHCLLAVSGVSHAPQVTHTYVSNVTWRARGLNICTSCGIPKKQGKTASLAAWFSGEPLGILA